MIEKRDWDRIVKNIQSFDEWGEIEEGQIIAQLLHNTELGRKIAYACRLI